MSKLLLVLLSVMIIGCSQVGYTKEVPLVVKIAEREIGKGEQGGNNKGKEVKKYTNGKEVAWCAGFVSYVFRRAGKKGPYLLSAKSYWDQYRSQKVINPKSGDLILFYRGSRGSESGHVGIIEKVNNKTITTIEGNVGHYPARVKRITYHLNHMPNNFLGFIRI